jgi:hypothetical protein
MKFNTLTALIAVVAIGLGVFTFIQRMELLSLKNQISSQSSPMEVSASDAQKVAEGTVIDEKILDVNEKRIAFQYRCSGEAKKGLDRINMLTGILSYCVGDYSLVAVVGDQAVDIASGHAVDGHDAPVLQKVELLSDKGNVLISFDSSCASTLDCGAGMPTNYVTYLFRMNDLSSKVISNFPPLGTPVWNILETKALFIPDTCGGAGCSMAPIIGYDLANDSATDLTEEKAVGISGEDISYSDVTDAMGDRLPVWKSAGWNVGDTFTAIMIDIDGSQKQVKGTF